MLTEHGVKTITGCVIDQLFAAIPDHTNKSVKVVFNGRKEFSGPDGDAREMKLYDLYVEE